MRSISRHIIILVLAASLLPAVMCAEDYMYWSSNFDPISMPDITFRNDTRTGNRIITLYTTGDAEISADNTASGPAELSCATDVLVTEYRLTFDGDGTGTGGKTGGIDTSYETYDTFLSTPVAITYIEPDDNVEVTLYVRANNPAGKVANSGTYNATQTLTVSWTGP